MLFFYIPITPFKETAYTIPKQQRFNVEYIEVKQAATLYNLNVQMGKDVFI